MNYTKGKWLVKKHGITSTIICYRPEHIPYEVAERIYNKTNANLIAAAPDMYEALKSILWDLKQHAMPDIGLVKTVLAKAEGKNDSNTSS